MNNSTVRSFYRMKSAANKTRNGQRGLSILGALLALVIGALLTIPIINAFLDSQRKTRVENALQDMRTIVADSQRTFGTTNQYAGLSTETAIQSNIIPARLRIPGTLTAQNGYNGLITVAVQTITVANDSSSLVWNNVPRSDCVDIALGIEQLGRAVLIGATQVKPNDGVIDAAATAVACDANDTAAVQVRFGRKG